jgi:IS30 family transposase
MEDKMSKVIEEFRIGKTNDRRRKLTEVQKEEIRALKDTGLSKKEVAAQYGCDRRTIDFIWYPELLKRNIQLRQEKGGSSIYYNKEKHRQYMQTYRNHKRQLLGLQCATELM